MLHDLADLDLDPAAAGLDVVVAGHSHRPRIEAVGGVLHLNPGSAGPRRFALPVTLATLELTPAGSRRGSTTSCRRAEASPAGSVPRGRGSKDGRRVPSGGRDAASRDPSATKIIRGFIPARP